MATVYERKAASGLNWTAMVRVKPYKPSWKSFATKREADQWAAAHERELKDRRKRGGLRADLTTLTLGGLVQEFLEDPGTKAKSADYVEILGLLLSWWVGQYGSVKVLSVDVLLLRDARAKLVPGRKPATVNRYLSAMRSAWNWGRSSGLIPMDMLWPTRLLLQEPTGRTRYLDAAELGRVLTAAADAGPLMYAAVVTSIATGMRQGELLRLTWADVDGDRQLMRLLVTKNKTPRSVHLPASAVAAINAIRAEEAKPEAAVFPISKQALMNRWQRVSVDEAVYAGIDALSDAFDTYLMILGPDGRLQENDDSSGTNSHVDARFTSAGRAHVVISSYHANESGAYQLSYCPARQR